MTTPPRAAIVYLPKAQGTTIYATSKASPAHELLVMAKAINVFATQRAASLSIETLLKANPDVLFTAPTYVSRIMTHRALQSMRAVRNKRVYGIQPRHYTSTRYHVALDLMQKALYPTTANKKKSQTK